MTEEILDLIRQVDIVEDLDVINHTLQRRREILRKQQFYSKSLAV